jgi:hypothetical protein
VIGKMIKHTEKDFIITLMELSMKENGLKINNTEMELRPGQMELNMQVLIVS